MALTPLIRPEPSIEIPTSLNVPDDQLPPLSIESFVQIFQSSE